MSRYFMYLQYDSVLQRVLDASFDSHYLVFEISTQSIATGGTPPSDDLLDLQR